MQLRVVPVRSWARTDPIILAKSKCIVFVFIFNAFCDFYFCVSRFMGTWRFILLYCARPMTHAHNRLRSRFCALMRYTISGQILSDNLTTLLQQSLMVHCSNSLLRVFVLVLCYQSATHPSHLALDIRRMDRKDKSLIITLFFVTLLYGIYLPMYVTSMRVLLQPSGDHALKTTALIRRTFLVFATLIFVLETLCVVFELWWSIECFDFLLFKPRTSHKVHTSSFIDPEKMRKRDILDIVQVRNLA
jgi:hypothetical protein